MDSIETCIRPILCAAASQTTMMACVGIPIALFVGLGAMEKATALVQKKFQLRGDEQIDALQQQAARNFSRARRWSRLAVLPWFAYDNLHRLFCPTPPAGEKRDILGANVTWWR